MWESWILVLALSPTPFVPPRAWGSLPTLGAEAGVWAVGVPASMGVLQLENAQLKMTPGSSEQELCKRTCPATTSKGRLRTAPARAEPAGALAAQGAGAQTAGTQAGAVGARARELSWASAEAALEVWSTPRHRGPWEAAWAPIRGWKEKATFDPAEGRGGRGAPSKSCTAGQSKLAAPWPVDTATPPDLTPLGASAAQKPPFLKADPGTPDYVQATYVQAQHPATCIRKPN